MSSFETRLKQKLAQLNLQEATPSLQMQVYKAGRLRADLQFGPRYKYYDLASLTKIIFTVPAMMQTCDLGLLRVTDRVSEHLPWWPHKSICVRDILSHSAGLPWWAPFYKTLNLQKSPLERREALRKLLQNTVRSRSSKALYSDIDFILLGFLLEAVFQKPLLDIWSGLPFRKFTPSLHFNLNAPKYSRALYAPTEKCPWRKKVLQGEVHDDNTWSFGGVSSHAGLFGTIEDVSEYGLLLRKAMRNKAGSALCSHQTALKFTRRAIPRTRGDWALGFMLPTKGQASCGKHFSSASIGHTGFTGTSLWLDPKSDVLITILSHRVHPTRDNRLFVSLRPQLHDLAMELL